MSAANLCANAWRQWLWPGALLCLLPVVFAFNLFLGASELSATDVIHTLLAGTGQEHVVRVVWELRLPRAIVAALVGAQLALAGFMLQSLTRNPLADSGLLGISAGASLGAVLVVVGAGTLSSGIATYQQGETVVAWLPVAALIGGLFAAVLVYWLSGASALTPLRLILTGVVCAAILNALVTGLLGLWGHAHTETIAAWLAGSLNGRGWEHLRVLAPWSAIGLLSALLIYRPMRLLRLVDEQGLSLGLHLSLWRLLTIATATLLTASAVAVSGPIGFIGLVVPHLARGLAPGHMSLQYLMTAIAGATIVLAGDLTGRLVLAPYELPVGVLAASIGVPAFLYLLRRQP